jgi:dual specificity MAP kinase phosphatase
LKPPPSPGWRDLEPTTPTPRQPSFSFGYDASHLPPPPPSSTVSSFADSISSSPAQDPETPLTGETERSLQHDPTAFLVSTILPDFLYLGPEPSTQAHVELLQEHGVRRIVNVAEECDDDLGLDLGGRFDRYVRIPMRDDVEESEVVIRGVVRGVCDVLGAFPSLPPFLRS